MIVIEAPNHIPLPRESLDPLVFLAGSIEMGKAIDWQTEIINAHEGDPVTFLNPRRSDWDSSWEQSIDNPQFKEQVTWELDGLERADFIFLYFDPNTMSPISLLELGLYHGKGRRMLVYCPKEFWRKGNVDIVCERHNILLFDDIERAKKVLTGLIYSWESLYFDYSGGGK